MSGVSLVQDARPSGSTLSSSVPVGACLRGEGLCKEIGVVFSDAPVGAEVCRVDLREVYEKSEKRSGVSSRLDTHIHERA